ncbi:glycosyltransferase [Ramlibacter terrae]|uniref:Glycosyltransferase n=1 Tax=Ramlibacter terrae TaxID=2732511 RepID=A0ABX6P663_9BURK|nr:glycosyltransferase [Ramlibacter terrae]
MARIARRFDPDLVQGWLYHGNLGASLARAALGRRVPLVWGIRQSLPTLQGENVFARIGIALNRMGSSRPDRVLFNSRTSLEQHRERGFSVRRAAYLPNGFDIDGFVPDAEARARRRAEWNIAEGSVAFGLFARFHPVKDHAGFLQAARRVHDARPGTCFVLAGTGIDAENSVLARAIAEAGLQGQVRLLGERRDIADLLPALDGYVSSSTREAFSNSIGEAMSCALPCVVTDVGDSRAVVADTARVVPPGDPAAMADAMIALVDLGAQGRAELGARARQRVVDEFGLDVVAGRYAALYRELAAGKA